MWWAAVTLSPQVEHKKNKGDTYHFVGMLSTRSRGTPEYSCLPSLFYQ